MAEWWICPASLDEPALLSSLFHPASLKKYQNEDTELYDIES